MGPVAQVGCHPFCSIAASVDENHLASATSHDGRHCTCGANRTRANYSDLHDVSSSVLGIFREGCRAKRRARASPRAGFGKKASLFLIERGDVPRQSKLTRWAAMKVPASNPVQLAIANILNN